MGSNNCKASGNAQCKQNKNQTGSHVQWSFLHTINESHSGYNLKGREHSSKRA